MFAPTLDRTTAAVSRMAARRVATRFVDPNDARTQAEEVVERKADISSWVDVVDGDDVVGGLWLGSEGEELVVYDVTLERTSDAPELLSALIERARGQGARMVGIGVAPDDSVQRTIGCPARAPSPGHEHGAAARRPDRRPDAAGAASDDRRGVRRLVVTEKCEGYAQELAATGLSPEQALERSRDPDGRS